MLHGARKAGGGAHLAPPRIISIPSTVSAQMRVANPLPIHDAAAEMVTGFMRDDAVHEEGRDVRARGLVLTNRSRAERLSSCA